MYVKLASALSLSVPVNVIMVGVDPSVSKDIAPLGLIVKVGVALMSATLYHPLPVSYTHLTLPTTPYV